MSDTRITKETLIALAAAAGLELGDDKLDELLPQVSQAMESLGAVDALDLSGIEPAIGFKVDALEADSDE